jgi:hypothetical protein
MSGGPDPADRTVPTLTEIVRPSGHALEGPNLADPLPVDPVDPVDLENSVAPLVPANPVDRADPVLEAELSRRVLVELHCRLADDLETHLRRALAPVIADLTATLVRETQSRAADILR